jgi:hypothetical protein
MQIFVRTQRSHYKFWLYDGNCGSGTNEDVQVIGSPLAVHLAADEACLPESRRSFFFCDRKNDRLEQLRDLFTHGYPRLNACSYLLAGDNEGALEQFAEAIVMSGEKPRYAIGLVIIDPNGWFYRNSRTGEGPPIRPLADFFKRFERIDVLLNLNYRIYKMLKKNGAVVDGPEAVLKGLNKRFWLVGKIDVGNSRFFVAVGRNTPTGDHRAEGMYDWRSAEARQIFQEIEERRQDGALPIISGVSEASRLSRGSNGSTSPGQGTLPLREAGNRSPPLAASTPHLPAVGNLRHTGEPEGDLP